MSSSDVFGVDGALFTFLRLQRVVRRSLQFAREDLDAWIDFTSILHSDVHLMTLSMSSLHHCMHTAIPRKCGKKNDEMFQPRALLSLGAVGAWECGTTEWHEHTLRRQHFAFACRPTNVVHDVHQWV